MRRLQVSSLLLLLTLLLAPTATTSRAEMMVIEAGRDTTLIEDPDGVLANGSGPVFFAGRTSQTQNSVRRALLWFDVAAALPSDARIEDVQLILTTISGNEQVANLRVHRVLADWGEGSSSATGGGGAPSAPGDATWLHTFYGDRFWARSGGTFVGHESAARPVAGPAVYIWENAPGLVHDVRLWLAAPRRNFGWILIGDETARQTSKRFASRQNSDPSLRPALEITYSRRRDLTGNRSLSR